MNQGWRYTIYSNIFHELMAPPTHLDVSIISQKKKFVIVHACKGRVRMTLHHTSSKSKSMMICHVEDIGDNMMIKWWYDDAEWTPGSNKKGLYKPQSLAFLVGGPMSTALVKSSPLQVMEGSWEEGMKGSVFDEVPHGKRISCHDLNTEKHGSLLQKKYMLWNFQSRRAFLFLHRPERQSIEPEIEMTLGHLHPLLSEDRRELFIL